MRAISENEYLALKFLQNGFKADDEAYYYINSYLWDAVDALDADGYIETNVQGGCRITESGQELLKARG